MRPSSDNSWPRQKRSPRARWTSAAACGLIAGASGATRRCTAKPSGVGTKTGAFAGPRTERIEAWPSSARVTASAIASDAASVAASQGTSSPQRHATRIGNPPA